MATTRHLCSLYAWHAGAAMPGAGVVIGHDLLSGGLWAYDPWELYSQGVITNPNALVIGEIGSGKSSLVKGYVYRQVGLFGRQAYLLDPKGEYAGLAEALAMTTLRLVPGGRTRLNPLDTGLAAGEDSEDLARRQGEMVVGLAEAALGRPVVAEERAAVSEALVLVRSGTDAPQLAKVAELLLRPEPSMASALATTPAALALACREVALELRRLLSGDLAGMFDGRSTVVPSRTGPGLVLDLSAVFGSPALALVMLMASSWLQVTLASAGPRRILVLDEAWSVLADVGTTRWLQATYKLSRAYGLSNIAVVHRLSDLRAQGADGSEAVKLAQGLLADTATRVMFSQASDQIADARELLGLSDVEAEVLPRLPVRGRALWRVGAHSSIVDHVVGPAEWALVDTDAAMRVA